MTKRNPFAIIIIPNVAMKGGIFIFEIAMPLTNPANALVAKPAKMPSGMGNPRR